MIFLGIKIRTALLLMLSAVLLGFGVSAANAQENLTRIITGSVLYADGQPAPDGVEIEAQIAGTNNVIGMDIVDQGTYIMGVAALQGGTTVEFYAEGVKVHEAITNSSSSWTVNLTIPSGTGVQPPVASPPVTAPPVVTPYPTSTPYPTQAPSSNQQPTYTPMPTYTPIPAAESESSPSGIEGFNRAPTVRLRPVIDEIGSNEDGIIELVMTNPRRNDVNLIVEMQLSVPSGLHVSSTHEGFDSGAGLLIGYFEVQPGHLEEVEMIVQADKTGKFTINANVDYWAHGHANSNERNISLSHPFTVHQVTSRNRVVETGGGSSAPPQPQGGGNSGGSCNISPAHAYSEDGTPVNAKVSTTGMPMEVSTLLIGGAMVTGLVWFRRKRG